MCWSWRGVDESKYKYYEKHEKNEKLLPISVWSGMSGVAVFLFFMNPHTSYFHPQHLPPPQARHHTQVETTQLTATPVLVWPKEMSGDMSSSETQMCAVKDVGPSVAH